jgi:hypothetical protein
MKFNIIGFKGGIIKIALLSPDWKHILHLWWTLDAYCEWDMNPINLSHILEIKHIIQMT